MSAPHGHAARGRRRRIAVVGLDVERHVAESVREAPERPGGERLEPLREGSSVFVAQVAQAAQAGEPHLHGNLLGRGTRRVHPMERAGKGLLSSIVPEREGGFPEVSTADLNYHHLRLFRAVARAGSVAGAARELHLTPQTVSEQVRALEESLGAVLLERSGRSVVPTETGRLVASYADDIFQRGRELQEVVRQRASERPLHVVFGVADVMPKVVVAHLLEPVFALAGRVHVTCREDHTDRLLAALALHEVDVVLSDAPAPPHLRFRTFDHLLGACGATLVAAPALAQRLRRGFPGSLDGAPLLVPTPGAPQRTLLQQWWERRNVHPVVTVEYDDSALAKELAAAGVGAMVVPSVIAAETARRHGLRVVATLDGIEERFYAISAERRLAHPAVVALAEAARSALFQPA